MKKSLCSLSILLLALTVTPAFSQLDTGTITGRVTDASGALVPSAEIAVVNTETNFTSDSKTNTEGLYRVAALRAGPYRITVKASGFKTSVREGLDLHIGETQEVNVALEVGANSESIRITAEAAQLQTESSAGGAVLEGDYLKQLPLYQRYVEDAFFLLPNIDIQGFGYAGNLQGFHIDGLPDNKIGFFQDGTYAVSNNNGTIYTAQNIQSTVEEVKMLGSVLPAEYGHSGGGALMSVQRTGTNAVHGEISEFGRGSFMQQRKYFDAYKYNQPQPGFPNGISELFQQPNATLSGPVYLPKLYNGKNKTFFVFAVERVIEKQGKVGAYTVPDSAMLGGDFSFANNLAPGTAANQLYDPESTRLVNGVYMRDPFSGNVIPASRISSVAKKLISLNPWAAPNAPTTYSTTGPNNNFNGTYLKKYFSENYTGRVDHQFSPSVKIFGNWLYKSIYQRSPNPNITNPIFDASLVAEHDYDNTATLGLTKIFSPSLIMEARVGYNRFEASVVNPYFNAGLATQLGIPNDSGGLLPGGVPYITTPGAPSEQVLENFTVKDDFTWVKNTHSFKFGYDLLHSRQNNYNAGNPSGNFTYDSAGGLAGNCPGKVSGGSTCPSTGGISLASFLLGDVSSSTFSIPTASWLPRDNVHSFFFQDDWKVNRNLTLNLGVRWAMESPWHTKYGQFSQFDPNATDPITGLKGAITHPGGNMTNREWQAPEPRIGFAWHPKDRLVVRGGFAMMHLDMGLAPSQLSEYSISSTQQNAQSGNPTPIYNISQGPNPIVFTGLTAQGTQPFLSCGTSTVGSVTLPSCSGRTTTFTNPNLKNPYTMTWNFAVQYQFTHNLLIEGTYDGSGGVGLIETPNINVLSPSYGAGNTTLLSSVSGNSQFYRPMTDFGDINERWNTAHSTYHSGTLHLSKRLSGGLLWDSFFTYAKSIDGTGVSSAFVDSHLYKGPSSFDRRMRYVGNFSYDLPFGRGRHYMNKGGVLNALLGGYTLVWEYAVYSGNPLTFTEANTVNSQISSILSPWLNSNNTIQARPNVIGNTGLRDDWQDLGPNRITCIGTGACSAVQGNQNPGICCLTSFAEPASYTYGNVGKNTFYSQRGVGASLSARKEFVLKERLKFQIRGDFQNPFKWYNWGNPTTAVDLKNVTNGVETGGNNFGKWATGNEATTVADGGVPMFNLTLKLLW